MRPNGYSYRYRVDRPDIVARVARLVGGLLRSSRTLGDYHRVCGVLGVEQAEPRPLEPDSHWFGGYFDGRGALEMLVPEPGGPPIPQLELRERRFGDLEPLRARFGGSLNHDTTSGGIYRWVLEG
jgi:hypothetical protein